MKPTDTTKKSITKFVVILESVTSLALRHMLVVQVEGNVDILSWV
jgi:hypothetical protein